MLNSKSASSRTAFSAALKGLFDPWFAKSWTCARLSPYQGSRFSGDTPRLMSQSQVTNTRDTMLMPKAPNRRTARATANSALTPVSASPTTPFLAVPAGAFGFQGYQPPYRSVAVAALRRQRLQDLPN